MSAVLSMLFVLLVALTFLGLGWHLTVWLDQDGRLTQAERALTGFMIGMLILSQSISFIGRIRLDSFSMIALGAALFLCAVPGLRAAPWADLRKGLLSGSPWLTGLLVLVCLSSLLQGLAPTNDYDSLNYHMAVPKADIERGYIAPDWGSGMPHVLFPALIGNLSRFALAIVGEQAAQPMAGLAGLAATIGTGLLGFRMGLSRNGACLAALLFAAVRAVVWEMGTVEVDLPLAASSAAALIVLLATRPHPSIRSAVMLGVMLGIGFNTKYHGGVIAIVIGLIFIYELARWRTSFLSIVASGAASLAVFTPQMVFNWLYTGNPIFPMLNRLFVPQGVYFFSSTHAIYGTGREFLDFLAAPWTLSAMPMQFFDGMVLGAPYFLALMPAALLGKPQYNSKGHIFFFFLAYFSIWFFALSQQVRFLLPVLPAAAVLAAMGAIALWTAFDGKPVLKLGALALYLMLGFNQAMFVCIYAMIRLPVAIGLVGPTEYHAKTPTLQGANYVTCHFISKALKPGEHYVSLLGPHSSYCPQISAIRRYFKDEEREWLLDKPRSTMDFPEYVARVKQLDIRFVVIPTASENRRNDTGLPVFAAVDFNEARFGPFIESAIRDLTPVVSEPRSAVYDGKEVLAKMDELLSSGAYPQIRR
ncbi:conserved membrane hypothetical protein [Rhodospirillaceae bacterium LM-1]|nr:conserved membrane hypothetical protein [Rhodospirillaceae bacterium LM-1]